jgi:hypothetical protein
MDSQEDKTLNKVRRKYYWLQTRHDVESGADADM